MNDIQPLDLYLPEHIRTWFEQTYYQPINERATLEYLSAHSREFLVESPAALYADHGVVHMRDVATRILEVLEVVNGVLIPRRSRPELERFLKSYGLLLAYLHDIGMREFTPFARRMHPELAAQLVFSPDLDAVVDEIWSQNYGNLAWRLLMLSHDGAFRQPPETVLRELMAMCFCHSKSKVPSSLLGQPARLRALLQRVIGTDLHALHELQDSNLRLTPMHGEISASRRDDLARHYGNFEEESFAWMVESTPGARRLLQDAIDTARALRCADAL